MGRRVSLLRADTFIASAPNARTAVSAGQRYTPWAATLLVIHARSMTLQQRHGDLVYEFADVDGVIPPPGGSGFGRGALRYRRKIFAMVVRGQLVVKLPRQRVDGLVADGQGERFDANKGLRMKEWFSLHPESDWRGRPAARSLPPARPQRRPPAGLAAPSTPR